MKIYLVYTESDPEGEVISFAFSSLEIAYEMLKHVEDNIQHYENTIHGATASAGIRSINVLDEIPKNGYFCESIECIQ